MKKRMLFNQSFLLLFLCTLFSCENDQPVVDMSKLTRYKWVSERYGTPRAIISFGKEKVGVLHSRLDLTSEGYRRFAFTWLPLINDSIRLIISDYGTYTFRIYALNDSNLVMNDWMTGGTSDTSKLVFYLDKTGSVAQ